MQGFLFFTLVQLGLLCRELHAGRNPKSHPTATMTKGKGRRLSVNRIVLCVIVVLAGCGRTSQQPYSAPVERQYVYGAPVHLKTDRALPAFRSTSDFKIWLNAWMEAKQEALKTRAPVYTGHVVRDTQHCFEDRNETHTMPRIPQIGEKAFVVTRENIFVTDTRVGTLAGHAYHVRLSNSAPIISDLDFPRTVGKRLVLDGVGYKDRTLYSMQFSSTFKNALVLDRAIAFQVGTAPLFYDTKLTLLKDEYVFFRRRKLDIPAIDRDKQRTSYIDQLDGGTPGKIYSAIKSDGSWPDEPFLYEWRFCRSSKDGLACRTTRVLASNTRGNPIYDESAAYLWLDYDVSLVENPSDDRPYLKRPRRVLKIPFDGSPPSSSQILGCPSHQAGIQPDKKGGLVALVMSGAISDQADFASLVRIKRSDFGGYYSAPPANNTKQITWAGRIIPFTAYENGEFLYLGDNVAGWESVQIPSKSRLMQISLNSGALKVSNKRAPSRIVALTFIKFGYLALSNLPGGVTLSFLSRKPDGLEETSRLALTSSEIGNRSLSLVFDPAHPGWVAVQAGRRVSVVKIEQFPVKMRVLAEYDFRPTSNENGCYGPIRAAFFDSGVMLHDDCRMVRGVVQNGTLKWLPEQNVAEPLATPSSSVSVEGAQVYWQRIHSNQLRGKSNLN